MSRVLLGVLILGCVVGSPLRADDPRPLRLDLATSFLPTKIAGASRIVLTGTITGQEGEGELILDPNRCGLDNFGDPTICTEIAPLPRKVTFQQSRQQDPKGQGRRLFSINGEGFVGNFALIVPARPNGNYRLVHTVEMNKTVVTFERQPAARGERGGEAPMGEKVCTPLPKTVDGATATAVLDVKRKVLLHLIGSKPHANTTVELRPVTYIRQPEYWQIDVVECSEGGITLPAIDKYKVTTDITGSLGTKGVVLSFANGESIKIDVPR